MALGKVVFEMVGPLGGGGGDCPLITRVKGAEVALCPAESTNNKVTAVDPAVVGRPEITPVLAFRLNPAGSAEPGANPQVYGVPVPDPATW